MFLNDIAIRTASAADAAEIQGSIEMKDNIRSMILGLGADVCGFASASDMAGAPEGFRPTDIYAKCQSVIVFGIALPKWSRNSSTGIITTE